MIRKKIGILLVSFTLYSVFANKLIGGWYPVFISDTHSPALNNIIANIVHHKIKKIVINYTDENKALAISIRNNINQHTNYKPQLSYTKLVDNAQNKFNHKTVVLIIWNLNKQ
jgi:hypothetical protein